MKQKIVTIVEDDLDIQEVISLVLSGNGYDIHTCRTAGDLRQQITQQLPDLIVLDIRLPDGNGIEICQELKTNPVTGNISIILMSANEYQKEHIGLANAFISKPFDIDNFRNKVEGLLYN